MGNFIPLLAAGICSAIASILLRVAGTKISIFGLAFLSPLWIRGLAVSAYGIGFILYAMALRKIPLTVAYPFMVAVTMVCVTLFSATVEHSATGRQITGAFAVMVGIWFLTSK